MKELINIVETLNRGERKILQDFCEFKLSKNPEKKYQLLEMILRPGKPPTEEEVCLLLYDGKKTSALSQLKKVLKDEILSLMLLQNVRGKYKTKTGVAIFSCRRYIMFGYLLLTKGLRKEAQGYIRKALKIAMENEMLIEIIQCYDLLRRSVGKFKGEKQYKQYSDAVIEYAVKLQQKYTAEELLKSLEIPNMFAVNQTTKMLSKSNAVLKEVKEIYEQTELTEVGAGYYRSIIYFYYYSRDFEKAKKYAYEFMEFVKSQPLLNMLESNVAGVNLQLATINIQLEQYEEAEKHCIIALDKFRKGFNNELSVLENLFFCYFRTQQFEKANEIIIRAMEHPQYRYAKFYEALWLYYKANLHFVKKEYSAAFQVLRENSYLMHDKAGWQLGYRLLEVLTMYECFGQGYTDMLIDNFNKLLQRQKRENISRIKIILKIFQSLQRNNFDFKRVVKTDKTRLEQLANGEDNYYWDPSSYEVIRFDEWFYSKIPPRRRR